MDEEIFTKLTELAACLCANIDSGNEMCFCGVIPGDQWYDLTGTCETKCGQAWVRLAGTYPSVTLGQPDLSLSSCQSPLALTLEVGVIRCVLLPEGAENLTDAQWLVHAQQQVKDMNDIRNAVRCCESFDEYIFATWLPIGPQGGIVGGAWTLTAGTF